MPLNHYESVMSQERSLGLAVCAPSTSLAPCCKGSAPVLAFAWLWQLPHSPPSVWWRRLRSLPSATATTLCTASSRLTSRITACMAGRRKSITEITGSCREPTHLVAAGFTASARLRLLPAPWWNVLLLNRRCRRRWRLPFSVACQRASTGLRFPHCQCRASSAG
jgi:hypothetical protein